MKTLQALFTAHGESKNVLTFTDNLTGQVQQRLAVGEQNPATQTPMTTNCVIMKLPLSNENDSAAMQEVQQWLEKHSAELQRIDAKKTLEFQLFLDENIGSRIMTVPNAIIKLCGDLSLDVATQAIRELSESELAKLRSAKG